MINLNNFYVNTSTAEPNLVCQLTNVDIEKVVYGKNFPLPGINGCLAGKRAVDNHWADWILKTGNTQLLFMQQNI